MESEGGTGFRGAIARLRHAPLWVWLTVLLTAGLLLFAYLQYRKSNSGTSSGAGTTSAALGTVPSDGAGQPLWNTADTSGMLSNNGTELAALLAYLQSQQTPNPTPTATPSNPPSNPPARPTLPTRPVTSAPQVPTKGYLPVRPIIWKAA